MIWNGQQDDVDCARTQCYLQSFTEFSGELRTPISFDPSLPAPPTPTITLTPDGPFDDGDSATLGLDGLPRLGQSVGEISGALCSTEQTHCRSLTFNSPSDSPRDVVQLHRMLPSTGQVGDWLDCAVDECVLNLWTSFGQFSSPVSFDDSAPAPPVPKFTTEQVNGEIVVIGTNVDQFGEVIFVRLCPQNGSDCPEPDQVSDVEWRFEFASADEAADCLDTCWGNVFGEGLSLTFLLPDGLYSTGSAGADN